MPDTLPGIDVSRYQQAVDWEIVSQSGVKYCFIKATEGSGTVDSLFLRNWKISGQTGLSRGAYHFFHPTVSPVIQAELFLRTVRTLEPGDLPPVLDLEIPADWSYIPAANRAPLILKWLEIVEAALGITPMIYLSPAFANEVLKNSPLVKRFPVWIAHYTGAPAPQVPQPWKTWTFWQYTGTGRTAGVAGIVDLNRFNGSPDDLKALAVQEAPRPV